jgi:DNA polymerase (family 10)
VSRLADGGMCELVITDPEHAGAALVIATGSSAHVEGLRARAAAGGTDLAAIVAPDEAGVYSALGLAWLPPEVRDGDDELVRAAAGETFADLVTLADLTGVIHCHTVYSDGKNTIEEMARAAHEYGLGLITITDHSVSAGYAGGLSEDRLREQWKEIAEVQSRTPVRLLRGIESDILADGALDYPTEVLGELDVVIASIHMRHKLDRDGMTRRVVAAMRQPIFKIWGHALGRLVLRRDPIDIRFDEVLDAIAASPAAIELNGDPHRLDLDPVRARQAKARGIKFVLSADAHATGQINYLENAVAMARRARLTRADILNTLPVDELADAVRPLRA